MGCQTETILFALFVTMLVLISRDVTASFCISFLSFTFISSMAKLVLKRQWVSETEEVSVQPQTQDDPTRGQKKKSNIVDGPMTDDSSFREDRIIRQNVLASAAERENTFESDWLYGHVGELSVRQMARAGFYRIDRNTSKDMVRCRYCNVCVHVWEDGDTPLGEHKKHSAKCVFLLAFPNGTDDEDEYEKIQEFFPYCVRNPNVPRYERHSSCLCCFCANYPDCVFAHPDSTRCVRCGYNITYRCGKHLLSEKIRDARARFELSLDNHEAKKAKCDLRDDATLD